MLTTIAYDNDVYESVNSPVVVESEHVDPPLSFDVFSGFVSCSDDVLALSSYTDMSIFFSIFLSLVTPLYLRLIHLYHRYLI